MKFSDLSPPTVPSLDEQRESLRKGLGRAMQWALHGQLADAPLLEACLQDGRFDRETADPRGTWLWKMIQAIGAADRFREPLLQALHDLADEDSAHQLCQLARHYAGNGGLTPCENCRFAAVRLLHSRQVIPEWVRQECQYDSGEDCRQLVSSSAKTTKTYFLALPNEQRVLLDGDRVLLGRLPYDQEKQQTLGDLLGQDPRCEGEWIYLPDFCVSRKHAMLTRSDDGHYAIEDTQSRSGTFVNDEAIRERTVLKVGDTIRIGQSTIEVFDESTPGFPQPGEQLGSD